jgi:hypothetical protein
MPKLILLPPGDANWRAAQAAPDPPGELLVIAHGGPRQVAGGDAQALAQRIRASGLWQSGLTVRLDACRSGVGRRCIAQQLAWLLAVPVWAPNARTLTFGRRSFGPWHSLNIPLTQRTLALWPGRWRRFEPEAHTPPGY